MKDQVYFLYPSYAFVRPTKWKNCIWKTKRISYILRTPSNAIQNKRTLFLKGTARRFVLKRYEIGYYFPVAKSKGERNFTISKIVFLWWRNSLSKGSRIIFLGVVIVGAKGSKVSYDKESILLLHIVDNHAPVSEVKEGLENLQSNLSSKLRKATQKLQQIFTYVNQMSVFRRLCFNANK